MELKPLGSSPVQVPVIGFGTWRYTGGVEPLRAVVERGYCFLDTAENYGTEEIVGEAIRGHRREVFLATKAAPQNFRRSDLIHAAENSLRRLGTDYIDLYQLHWPNLTIPIEETMGAMEELVDSGKIRFMGVSNFDVGYLRRAQRSLSRHKIVSNQVRYSLIDRTIERKLLPYCRPNAITVIAFSPLGLDFQSLKRADPAGVLTQVASSMARTEAQVALNWLISKDNVVTIPKHPPSPTRSKTGMPPVGGFRRRHAGCSTPKSGTAVAAGSTPRYAICIAMPVNGALSPHEQFGRIAGRGSL